MTHLFISAGEASGDLLGAELARALLAKNSALTLTGMGGKRMLDAGVNIQFNADKLSVVGITEIITHLPSILWTWHRIKKYLHKTKPDLIILIDFPDTHFRIMKFAKKIGIKVLYYVSPQIWAWRASRIHTIKKYVDHMAVLFAFEEKIYQNAGVPVTFVGHPLAQLVKPIMTTENAYAFFQLDSDKPIVALFPGSRHGELKNNLAVMLESVEKIRAQKPDTQFVLVLAPHFKFDNQVIGDRQSGINARVGDIKIIQNHLYDLLQITNAAIAVSGTVTLEIALMRVPLCIIYRLNRLSYWIAKMCVHTKYIGLCNIVAEKMVAKEWIQDAVTADAISGEILRLLNDKDYHAEKQRSLDLVKKQLDNKAALEKLTEVVIQLI